MDLKYIKHEVVEGVAWVRFDRPQKFNAVNAEVWGELERALVACEADATARVVVLTGNDKAFVAGADVEGMSAYDIGQAQELAELTMRVQERLADLPKPTIAAMAGFALGAGSEIALCCDFRIAAANAVIGQPEITLGIIPGGGGTQRLPRLINPAKAARMILLGETVKAPEALAIGLVDQVVELAELAETVGAFAARLARMPAMAVRAAKIAMKRGLDMSLKDGLRLELELFSMLFGTQDQKEGMAAFLEKRKPVYAGR